jgi:hypothetical protein
MTGKPNDADSSSEPSETSSAAGDPLYGTLVSFVLDDPETNGFFTARLMQSQSLSTDHARRAIIDYKKFFYFTQRTGHEVTPPPAVDGVWHLHLTYTQSYWGQLSGRVSGRPLHHVPGTGLPEQNALHRAHYAATLASYKRLFGKSAPADIWPRKVTPSAPRANWLDVQIADSAVTGRRVLQALLVGIGLLLCLSAL